MPCPVPDKTIDACGLLCPEPIMLLHNAVRDSQVGDVIQIVATDPSTKRDIKHFCEYLGHQLVEIVETEGRFEYFVRKA